MRTIPTFVFLAAAGVLTSLNAQAPSKPPDTIAELRAQIATLERDRASLQKDYQLLLAACRQPPSDSAATLPENAAPSPTDSEPQPEPWFVNGTGYTIAEDNLLYTRYTWTINITNADSKPRTFDISAEFIDEQGIVVRTGRLSGTIVEGFGAQRTLGSDTRIEKPAALRVRDVQITATPR
jgi:hypothetical protein